MIFSATSLLFGILAGFSISILWGRQETVRGVLNSETAILYSIYFRSAILGEKVQKKLAELIDKYLITTLECPLHMFETSRDDFVSIYTYIRELKVNEVLFWHRNKILEWLEKDFKNRVNTTFHAKTMLVPYLSYSVFLLGSMLLGLIIYMREPTMTSKVITIMLSSVVFLVMLLIRDLNQMKLWENIFIEVGVNQIFDVLGKKRFYNQTLLKLHYQEPKPGETYRTIVNGKMIEKTAPAK
jgi:hypothetical protein